MTILIAGGGIGGLTLALSLHQVGIPVRLFESEPEPRALGVGINILPHASRELTELGLLPGLDAIGIRASVLAYYSKHGKLIWREPRGVEAGYHWPQFSLHRGRLRQLLWDAAAERIGTANLLTGHHLRDWEEQASGGVRASFVDKSSGKPVGSYEGSLLIGADGIHSAMRAAFAPTEGPPKWSGAILWRGVTMAPPFLDGRTNMLAGHFHQKFVCYPISPPEPDGLRMTNWLAERRFPPKHKWRRETFDRRGRLEEFLPWFEGWRFDWLDIPALIRSALYVYEYPMIDRDPLPRWTYGRATLLGDAAHPMYPIGANGASQAILDARVLTREILKHGDTPEALMAYEEERRPSTARIVELNRQNGPDQVMQIVEERAPDGFEHIDDVMTRAELLAIADNYKRVAGFDRDILNGRGPIVPSAVAPMAGAE
jgi:2-polyprenyl-6-methoxyphenol hydroxylase-like FAD-dependent oxidoreductase